MKNSFNYANQAALTWDQPAPGWQNAGVTDMFRNGWERLRSGFRRVARPRPRDLSVSDITHLGDKRFIALIEVGPQRFLVGGSSQAMCLLAKLPPQLVRKPVRQVPRKPRHAAHRQARQVAPKPPAKRNTSKRNPKKRTARKK